MTPQDLIHIYPFNSVDKNSEHESHMSWLLIRLAENGNIFRELSFKEYRELGGKDNFEKLNHFNKYIKSEDTIRLYSKEYDI